MKTLKKYNEQVRKERTDWKKRQMAKYGDTRLRANVLCDNCHDKGKKVEMVVTNRTYSTPTTGPVVECPECNHEGWLDVHMSGWK
jgi:hypothetical protein